jgi:PPP family 3-phenylpropionic acid transporter
VSPQTRLKAVYAFSYAVFGASAPFLSVILHEQGLSDSEVAWALSGQGMAVLIAPMILAHLADRVIPVKHLLFTMIALTGIISPLWLMVYSLPSALALALFFFSVSIPAFAMLDAFTVNYVTTPESMIDETPVHFQSFRVWGSIGFVVPGLLLYPVSFYREVSLGSLLWAASGCACVALYLLGKLPMTVTQKQSATLPSLESLRVALRPPLRGIFLTTIIAGCSLSIFFTAFPRYLHTMGLSSQSLALVMQLAVIAEILLIPKTASLTRRFGTRNLIILGLLTIPLRFCLVALYPSLPLIIALQLLHAPLVVGLLIAIPIFLGEVAGDSYRFSLQSLNTTLTGGLARLIGPNIGILALNLFGSSEQRGLQASLITAGFLGLLGAGVLACSARESNREF